MAQKRREKAAREHRDVNQIHVAEAAGVSKGAISRYESDTDKPRDPVLERIATYLDTTSAFLRYGVGETTTPPVQEGAQFDRHGPEEITAAGEQAAKDRAARARRKKRKASGDR